MGREELSASNQLRDAGEGESYPMRPVAPSDVDEAVAGEGLWRAFGGSAGQRLNPDSRFADKVGAGQTAPPIALQRSQDKTCKTVFHLSSFSYKDRSPDPSVASMDPDAEAEAIPPAGVVFALGSSGLTTADGAPSKFWLQEFWRYISRHSRIDFPAIPKPLAGILSFRPILHFNADILIRNGADGHNPTTEFSPSTAV